MNDPETETGSSAMRPAGLGASPELPESDSEILRGEGDMPAESATQWTPLDTGDTRLTIDEYLGVDYLSKIRSRRTDNEVPEFREGVQAGDRGTRYSVGGIFAKGGMGAIMLARDRDIRRQVAMKVMLHRGEVREEDVLRFIEEAQVTGQLEHPNIVPVHELGIDASGNVFFTMKLVQGQTLKEVLNGIRRRDPQIVKRYNLNRLLTVFLKVCDAVAFAHARGVVHRDLKPSNIMIGDFGEVLVMDWGIAKILPPEMIHIDAAHVGMEGVATGRRGERENYGIPDWGSERIESARLDGDSVVTKAGQVMGTPNYMAPEQAYGKSAEVDQRSDIYALGGILYSLLTLQRPVEGSGLEIYERIVHGEIIHPSMFNPENRNRLHGRRGFELIHCPHRRIPESLTAVTTKAMALQPHDRYQMVEHLAGDIENYQAGFATGAEKANLGRQMTLLVSRNRREFVLVACIAVIAVGLMAWAFVRSYRRERRADAEKTVWRQTAAVRKAQIFDQLRQERLGKAAMLFRPDGLPDAIVNQPQARDFLLQPTQLKTVTDGRTEFCLEFQDGLDGLVAIVREELWISGKPISVDNYVYVPDVGVGRKLLQLTTVDRGLVLRTMAPETTQINGRRLPFADRGAALDVEVGDEIRIGNHTVFVVGTTDRLLP